MASNNSLSQGVFAFKKPGLRKKVAPKTNRRKNGNSNIKPEYSQPYSSLGKLFSSEDLDGNKREMGEKRSLSFGQCWQKASELFSDLQREMFSEVLRDVVAFVDKSRHLSTESNGEEIPTCGLLTGVNLPDHADLFSLLVSEINAKVSPHVAVLKSASCPTLKSLIQKTVSQIINDADSVEPEVKRNNQILPVLASWYQNQHPSLTVKNQKTGGTKRKRDDEGTKADSQSPIVIIIEDFEGFGTHILQDFILNLREYCDRLPLVLVFGVATTISTIHKTLPLSVTTHLSIEKFSGQPSVHLLGKLIERLVIGDSVTFKLGGKVLQLLLDTFLYHDFSVKTFLSGYKFCLLEHFSVNEVSALCSPDPPSIDALSHSELEVFRKLSSFREFVKRDPKVNGVLLGDDEKFRKALRSGLADLETAIRKFNALVSSLHSLTCQLPRLPLGKHLHKVYGIALYESITGTHEYREAFQLLHYMGKTELHNKLIDIGLTVGDWMSQSEVTALESLTTQLSQIDQTTQQQATTTEPPKKKLQLDSKVDRYKLKETLLEQAKEKRRTHSAYESLRTEALEFLHRLFRDHLVSPTTLPFHEVRFFDKAGAVRRHLVGMPRAAIQTALMDPGHYLQQNSEGPNEGSSAELPDVSVAYKLHLECGRLINLFDWLQCWISLVKGHETEAEPSEVDPLLQARFSQAVSELQFMGFIKASKRKTDHVARLTWGAAA